MLVPASSRVNLKKFPMGRAEFAARQVSARAQERELPAITALSTAAAEQAARTIAAELVLGAARTSQFPSEAGELDNLVDFGVSALSGYCEVIHGKEAMPAMNQSALATSLRARACLAPLLCVALGALGALGACDDAEPEPGLLVLDRESFDFGLLHVGQVSAEWVFTVRNAGRDRVHDLGVRLDRVDSFDVVGTTCVGWLEPSETCTITVAFAPSLAGEARTNLIVEADRGFALTVLEGTGAVTVRVVNEAADGTVVESEPAGIRCGVSCEATFTVPEIVLSAVGAGGVWSGPCASPGDFNCTLVLTEDTVVTLQSSVGVQWIYGSNSALALVTDARNDVIVTSSAPPYLFKLSSTGALQWENIEANVASTAAVDAQGNIGIAGYDGPVQMVDGDGNTLWSMAREQVGLTSIRAVAFDPSGALFVAGTQGAFGEEVAMLVKLGEGGSVLWSRSHAPGVSNAVTALVVDGSGNAVISGEGRTGPDGELTYFWFLRKYDGDGNLAWERETSAGELAVDAAGNLFAADSFHLQKYTPDGALLWDAYLDGSTITAMAVTPAGDVVAAGTRHDDDGNVTGAWAAKLAGASGAEQRSIQLPGEGPFFGHVAVDGNGDVLFADQEAGFGIRKYDGSLFDQPAD